MLAASNSSIAATYFGGIRTRLRGARFGRIFIFLVSSVVVEWYCITAGRFTIFAGVGVDKGSPRDDNTSSRSLGLDGLLE